MLVDQSVGLVILMESFSIDFSVSFPGVRQVGVIAQLHDEVGLLDGDLKR